MAKNDVQPGMGIGDATANLKDGHRVRRHGWPGHAFLEIAPEGGDNAGEIRMKDGRPGTFGVKWWADQADILATDWKVAD